jgi:hypothetical protein
LHQHDLPALDHLLDFIMPLRPPHRAACLLHLVAADRLDGGWRLGRLRAVGGAVVPGTFAGRGNDLAGRGGMNLALGRRRGVGLDVGMFGFVPGFRRGSGRRIRG